MVGGWLLEISHLRNVELAPKNNRTFSATSPCHQEQVTCPLSESLMTSLNILLSRGFEKVLIEKEVKAPPPSLCDLGHRAYQSGSLKGSDSVIVFPRRRSWIRKEAGELLKYKLCLIHSNFRQ